jgi:CheY-like chemotaxis protein
MNKKQMRCRSCGTRTELDINESDLRVLSSQGHLTRFCNQCAGQTRWLEQEASASSFRSEWATPSDRPPASVLVIDDDDSILAILKKALSQEYMDVQFASSARRAVQLLSQGDYDLILSDIRMPEFDGKQMFEFLDQHMPEYRARVVFLTGDTGNPETMAFLNEMQCTYLPKPIDIPKLLEILRRRLSHT